jgi:hypothetical protein
MIRNAFLKGDTLHRLLHFYCETISVHESDDVDGERNKRNQYALFRRVRRILCSVNNK